MRDKLSKTIIPGVVFLVFSIVMYLLMPEQVQTTETSAFTARTFPTMALGLIMLCGALLTGQGLLAMIRERRTVKAAAQEEKPAQDTKKSGNTFLLLEVLALMAVSVAIGNYTGLLVSGLLIGAGFLALYRDKKPLHYVIVIAIIAVSYFLFKQVFGLQLP